MRIIGTNVYVLNYAGMLVIALAFGMFCGVIYVSV